MTDPVVYTAEEASEILRMSVWTLRKKVKAGTMPHHRDGRMIKMTPADIDRYLDSTRVHTPQEEAE